MYLDPATAIHPLLAVRFGATSRCRAPATHGALDRVDPSHVVAFEPSSHRHRQGVLFTERSKRRLGKEFSDLAVEGGEDGADLVFDNTSGLVIFSTSSLSCMHESYVDREGETIPLEPAQDAHHLVIPTGIKRLSAAKIQEERRLMLDV